MTITKIPVRTVYDNLNNPIGLSEFQVGEVIAIAQGGTSANSVDNARANLNVTNSNIRSLFSVTGGGSYNNTTGVISINDPDFSPFAKTSDLTTANVIEVTNLYYTVSRANTAIDNRVTKSFLDNLGIDATTLDGIDSSAFALDTDLTTANVAEVNNLYFTNARAIASLVDQPVTMGQATITGNLIVLGNVVEFNTETLIIEDKNIVLANGSPNASASNGAGITVDGSNARLTYFSEDDNWEFNKDLSVDGSIDATGTITSPFFYSESDLTLKEDVNPIQDALNKVISLVGVDFVWKATKQKAIGVVAQNVEQVVPEIVGKSSSGLKTVQYDSLIPILIEAIKEQQKQIDELRNKLK